MDESMPMPGDAVVDATLTKPFSQVVAVVARVVVELGRESAA
ncbi:hypothetical protein ACFW5X_33465 [Streptomyces albogriseolus]